MRTSQYIAYFVLSAIAAVFIIVGLSTLEWRVYESNGTKTSIGLKKIKITSGSYEDTADIPNSGDGKEYLKGADTALSMGIIALGCIGGNVLLVALLKLCQGWTGGRARFIAIIFSLAAAILIIIGTITYDQKLPDSFRDNTDYGYSFALYVTGGLLPLLIALALMMSKNTM